MFKNYSDHFSFIDIYTVATVCSDMYFLLMQNGEKRYKNSWIESTNSTEGPYDALYSFLLKTAIPAIKL